MSQDLELGIQTRHRSFRPDAAGPDDDHAASLVLIEVPAIRPTFRRARRPSQTASARIRANVYQHGSAYPSRRRRLRREIRLGGYAALAALPLVLAAFLLHGLPAANPARRPVTAAVQPPPAVSISVEAAAPAAPARHKPPVVLHGYLLPDDGHEEPGHAGG